MNYLFFFLCYLITQQGGLQEGDLLFQDSDCGPFCTAVEKVTDGYNGANLSHVGMVVKSNDGSFQVLEAITKGVVITPLDEFLERSQDQNGKPKVLIGRVKLKHNHLIPEALSFAKSKLNRPYDDVFELGNDSYYCSELIYEAFKNANKGEDVFHLNPMTFKDPNTGETFPVWEGYYEELGLPIPEGKLGLNPGGMSDSPYLNIIQYYGLPSGMSPSH